jgi:hypothetical protein
MQHVHTPKDEDALTPQRPDEALRDRVGQRSADGNADDLSFLRPEHFVEAAGKLGVVVADQEAEREASTTLKTRRPLQHDGPCRCVLKLAQAVRRARR